MRLKCLSVVSETFTKDGKTDVSVSGTDPAGPDGAAGSGPAKVTYSATADATKGGATIASTDTAGSSASRLLSTEGITTFSFFSTDTARNAELPNLRIVRLDKTKPVTTCPVTDGKWHAGNQTFTCTATDAMSGLANPSGDARFTVSTSVADGVETATASTDSRQVPDVAGNVAVAGPVVNNKIDRKDPTSILTLPATNTGASIGPSTVPTYLLGQTAKVAYSCADGGSGVSSCLG